MRVAIVLTLAIVGAVHGLSTESGPTDEPSTNYLELDYSSEESSRTGLEDNEISTVTVGMMIKQDNDKTSEPPERYLHQIKTLRQQLIIAKWESNEKLNACRLEVEAAKKDAEQATKNLQQLLQATPMKSDVQEQGQLGKNNDAVPQLIIKARIQMNGTEIVIDYNSAIQVVSCPDNFVSINGGCYHFNSYDLKDWNEALRKCQALESRSSLVTIESRSEWDSIRSYLTENNLDTKNWWIGGSDQQVEGIWKWAATNQPIGYGDWCRDEPNNHNGIEDCAMIAGPAEGFNRDNRLCWNDFPCKWSKRLQLPVHFICEIKNN